MVPTTVFIFTKPNRIGLSKTRLAKDVGGPEARRLNAMMTAKVLKAADDPRWTTLLSIAPDTAISDPQPLWPAHFIRTPQGGGDLGDRLNRAYLMAPHGKIIFLGTDMPDLTRQHIWCAIKLLNLHNAVFGPADDGGFWLAGFRKRSGSRIPFHNVRWSSKHTLADVITGLADRPVGFLETFIDVDDGNALKAWLARNAP